MEQAEFCSKCEIKNDNKEFKLILQLDFQSKDECENLLFFKCTFSCLDQNENEIFKKS